ncbi:MAG: MlaD family protein [Candidatus Cloacimonetes bacterium]|nr:MlaD family protein [Candidatus Cloacimonadota bacterium]
MSYILHQHLRLNLEINQKRQIIFPMFNYNQIDLYNNLDNNFFAIIINSVFFDYSNSKDGEVMINRAQKIRLTVFLLIGFLLIILFFVLVAGSKLMEKRDFYYVEFIDTSVNGLQIGSDIKYQGIKVGRVDDIYIDSDDVSKIIAKLSINRGVPIKTDVTAQLIFVGITGLKQIELTGGTNQAELLPPQSKIPTGESMIDNISGKAEIITEKVELVLNNINEILNDENKERLSNIIRNTDIVISSNVERINNIANNLDSLSFHLSQLTKETTSIITKINNSIEEEDIANIVANTSKFSTQLNDLNLKDVNKNVNQTVENLNRLIRHIDQILLTNQDEIPAILEILQETLDNLNEFSRLLSEDPSVIWKSRRQDD